MVLFIVCLGGGIYLEPFCGVWRILAGVAPLKHRYIKICTPKMVFCPYQLGLKCYAPVIFCFWPGVLGVFLYFGVLGYIWAIFVEFGPTNTGTFIFGTGATWCEGAARRCCFLFSHYFWAFLVFLVDNGIFSLCVKFEGQ